MPPLSNAPVDGAQLTLGIRPEHFGKSGAEMLELTIEIVENLGSETYAYARQSQSNVLTIAMNQARNLAPGDQLKAYFNPTAALLFDLNGSRIR